MNVRIGGEPIFVGRVSPPDTEHSGIDVDGGRVHIDAHDPEHVIRVRHDKNDGVDILVAIDNATDSYTARIDSAGVAHVANVKTVSKDYNDLFDTIEGIVVSNNR